jgi:ubiquinone/menaquinone biosynthesis C-methylase UbiE
MQFVLEALVGERVLEVGCGGGELTRRIAGAGHQVAACDLKSGVVERVIETLGGDADVRVARAEALPWPDRSFDTVVSTHTLEHIPNLEASLREMRRVARRRIVIVVPCQKYKRYTIDTHVHFFPTEAVLRWAMQMPLGRVSKVDGDWAIVSDRT